MFSSNLNASSMDLNSSPDNPVVGVGLKTMIKNVGKNLANSFVSSLKQSFKSGIAAGLTGINLNIKPDGGKVNWQVNRDLESLYGINTYTNRNESNPPPSDFIAIDYAPANNVPVQRYEDPTKPTIALLDVINTYKYKIPDVTTFEKQFDEVDGEGKKTNKKEQYLNTAVTVTPSLFNPFFGISAYGPTHNTPLLDNTLKKDLIDKDWDDCSIRTLVDHSVNGKMGHATYKYADFMYCADLGMPNNRLITLRKFATPVSDNIYALNSAHAIMNSDNMWCIGTMCTWFDTEDNKLENILSYEYTATWKEMNASWEQQESKEEDRPSPIGKIVNTFNSSMGDGVDKSIANGNNTVFGSMSNWIFGKVGITTGTEKWYGSDPVALGKNYDQHKIYEPKNTIRSTNLYEGNLKFNHEFDITFRYRMRSYDSINQKAAFLDLISNCLTVTYTRGTFWGGKNQILGPQPNTGGWKTAMNIVNNAPTVINGAFSQLLSTGSFQGFGDLLGSAASQLMQTIGIKNVPKDATFSEYKSKIGESESEIKDKVKNAATEGMKQLSKNMYAKMKNVLGRPQLYAFNTLLSGGATGLWHLTVGNPRNPIVTFGNLIVTKTTMSHSGPLGIDDFPTEIVFKVSLKHAQPRDKTTIEKMYGMGMSGIGHGLGWKMSKALNNVKDGIAPGTAGTVSRLNRGYQYYGYPAPSQITKIVKSCEQII